jgi:hypothetical protein
MGSQRNDVYSQNAVWEPTMAGAQAPPVAKALSAYPLALAQPVFFSSRKPFEPPPPPPPPKPVVAAKPPPKEVFVGPRLCCPGVILAEEARKAYLFSNTEPNGKWVVEGEEIVGWKLRSIDELGARLEKGDRAVQVRLYPER